MQGELYKALVALLKRDGVNVGNGAALPRIELHSWIVNAPFDKNNNTYQVDVIVESMSGTGYGDAVAMNGENLTRLLKVSNLEIDNGIKIIGICPDQLTELTEESDTNAIMYRQLQRILIFAEYGNTR